VVLTGARQTGKSTLVSDLPGRTYLTLDDLDVRHDAATAPDDLVARAPRLTLDEVQRGPDLLLAIKRAVDRRRTAGQFVLTGSANLLMMKRVADTLAGRATYLTLWPMTRSEQAGLGAAGRWADLFATGPDDWPRTLADGAVQRPTGGHRSAAAATPSLPCTWRTQPRATSGSPGTSRPISSATSSTFRPSTHSPSCDG
jgi:hypothetical protein